MPSITYTFDPKTGDFTAEVNGIIGPGCEAVEKLIAEAAGQPAATERKPEYTQTPVRQTVRRNH